LRKDKGLEVLDKISIEVQKDQLPKEQAELVVRALTEFKDYISTETQALSLEFNDSLTEVAEADMDEFMLKVKINKK
jgi:isoleucyl-tRNA synthetase